MLIAITTVLHHEVLCGLSAWLSRLPLPNHPKLLVVVFSAMVAHGLQIAVYSVWIFALVRPQERNKPKRVLSEWGNTSSMFHSGTTRSSS